MWVAALSFVFALGCDSDPVETDSGPAPGDSGPMVMTDGGVGTDSGPVTMTDAGPDTDAGGMTGMCNGPMGDCDVTVASSCGAGMACGMSGMSTTSWTTGCRAAGVGGQGSACTPGGTDCQEGFQCGSTSMTCQQFCCTSADCGTPGDFCGQVAGADVGFCQTPDDCDLIANTGCAAGTACYPGAGGLSCLGAGMLGEGEVCMFTNDCAPSHGCIGPMGGPSNCRAWCDMMAADPCPAGFACTGVGGLPVGACTPM